MDKKIKAMIIRSLFFSEKNALSKTDIFRPIKLSKGELKSAQKLLAKLCEDKIIRKNSKGKYYLVDGKSYFIGTVIRMQKKFGFVRNDDNDTDLFVPGHKLCGAVVGDRVLARITETKTDLKNAAGKIISIEKPSVRSFDGTVTKIDGEYYVVSEFIGSAPILIDTKKSIEFTDNEKVGFKILKRGEKHREHIVIVTETYGDADKADACVTSYLAVNNIPTEFSQDALSLADKLADEPIPESETESRHDLRSEIIFTIDGKDTKDIDDAVSIKRATDHYELGVHIADVSYYVKPDSPIEQDAYQRGTSIYIADRVIPMLPKSLSNGICSLNPNVDRLAFSCIIKIAFSGEILDYEFKKTVIKSAVQGVYSEINELLDNSATVDINKKYSAVKESIFLMRELANILNKIRIERGSVEIESVESKVVTDENGICTDVKPRTHGSSEGIIEEFMLTANRCAAMCAAKNDLPFVYRVHESPAPDKLIQLHDSLELLGIPAKDIHENSKPKHLAEVLRNVRFTPKSIIVNNMVLRSMAKAKYSYDPLGHFGLVLEDYAHFTSPIRRYSDLAVHRILSDYCAKTGKEKIRKKYSGYVFDASGVATRTELNAVTAERVCEKYYMAEYMGRFINESFTGIVSGISERGIFVQLSNTIEGFVSVSDLPPGSYEEVNGISLTNTVTKKSFTVGDTAEVICAGVNVSSGQIDFILKPV